MSLRRSDCAGPAERLLVVSLDDDGVPATRTHAGRHTVATLLLKDGPTIGEVAAILGDTPTTVSSVDDRVVQDTKRRLLDRREALG